MMRIIPLAIAIALAFAAPASADPRIREVVYAPEKVIRLVGHYGYQIAIEFPAPEKIESVALGDSLTWQVTPNKRGNVLFVKPVDEGEPTNMMVVTSQRYYTFELTAKRRTPETPIAEITYFLRISIPVDGAPSIEEPALLGGDAPSISAPAPINDRYTYSGSKLNLPSRVFDDGVSTTFEWPRGVETPAIFYRRPDGAESIVNYSYKGDAIIVHQIAPEFILRNGKEVTQIFNDAYREIERGPDAPQPRSKRKKKGGLFGLFAG
ncbi:MAG: TrbG/VirB9 family P-type conjugative transfer protein [Parvularculaceae bacterium]|nr:TrbG/VirB9 family P-type conjugative transfer protein [Parvularculaceae bacterium]